ncbi:M48 family metalloprotease [Candidatus Nitrospira allomarina]|uniref:M48 family metalloprotease n=1 Tax=Candidatus Nitrospira allomarina TaxID=3020900 RepID=A0AA96GC82_9BACT|nr:M48 family metalloprotease [Candidatus Nitrospira allomarina]WNM58357.1 M48 family metalloprotease [Candidatus Nitrospira allomarina]
MKTGKILASVSILSLLLSSMGCGGSQSGQSSQQTDLIGGLGAALGIKQQKIDLLKKGVGVVQALEPIGEEEEITLGEAVAVEAFSRFGGEYSNPAWTRYINLVGKTVAEVSDRPTLNYHFAILNSQEQNAFAAPGGYIFITVGLLKTLTNEAELAGVLAHEIAHVTQKHMLDAIRRGALMGSVSELTLTAMKQDPAMFSSVIDEMTDLLFTKGLDKDKEFEADVVGVEYAYRAGYNPQGLENYLQTLAKEEGHVESKFFTTHPSTSLRISKIDTLLEDYSDIKNLPFLAERFHQYVKAG